MLLDEIEKAHPDVFNTLLQIMDDGRMTDGQGRLVDFKNTIIIMTSNVGSDWILSEPDQDRMKDKVMEAVSQTFKPEFINRVDEIVVFHRLGKDDVASIVEIQVTELSRRLANRDLSISITESAKTYLAEQGYDPAFGARPLRRLISKQISDGIAMALLKGDFAPADTVEIDAEDGKLNFKKVAVQTSDALVGK